jgi:hypothetical protein
MMNSAYKDAHKPPRSFKDAITWLDRWETVMARAETKGVTEAAVTSDWAMDFPTALSPITSQQTSSYQIEKQDAITNGSLQYKNVANNFRRWLAVRYTDRLRIGKGAFATYAGKPEDEDPDNEQTGDKHISNDQKSTRSKSNRERNKRGDRHTQRLNRGNSNTCLACGLPHDLSTYYYVYPEKAHPKFRPRQRLHERVNEALENNVELQALVRGAKRTRGSSRTSSTPRPIKDESAPTTFQ